MVLRSALLAAVIPIFVVALGRSTYPTSHGFYNIEGEHDREPDQPHEHLGGERLAGV